MSRVRFSNSPVVVLLARLLLVVGITGCSAGAISSLRPGQMTDVRRTPLGKRIVLRVDPRDFREGHPIGDGAGTRLTLGQDMKKLLEADLAAAWSVPDSRIDAMTAPEDSDYLVTVIVDWIHVEWPEGIPVISSRATVAAQFRGTVVVQLARTSAEVFRQEYTGEASDDFMDYRYIATLQQWQGVLELAYRRFVQRINDDKRLIGMLQTVPAEPAPLVEQRPPVPRLGPVVAVFDMIDRSRKRDLDQVTRYLQTALTQNLGYRVIPQDQVRARLVEEKKAGYRECYDQSCQIELGRALAAEKILVTELLQVGGECVVTATLFDLKTETSERAANARTGCSDSGLLSAIDQVVSRLGSANQ